MPQRSSSSPHFWNCSLSWLEPWLQPPCVAHGQPLRFFWNDCQDSGWSLFWNLGPEGRGSITVDLLRSVGISVVIHTGAGHSGEHCFRPQEVGLRTVNQGDQAEQEHQTIHFWETYSPLRQAELNCTVLVKEERMLINPHHWNISLSKNGLFLMEKVTVCLHCLEGTTKFFTRLTEV